jgi:3-hydroxyisobutyrate dehydrogenase
MARNVARAGYLQAVWNRTEARAAALAAELGVACAPSPAELAASVDVMLLCVSADRDVTAVVEALLPAIRDDSVVVDFSTVSPATACAVAERVRQCGGEFLDAPVTGGVEGARNGKLAMMVGGDATTLERVRPLLQTMAARIVHMGDVGTGQATKAVNQVMVAGINQAVTEALSFAERLELDMDKVIEAISGGAAGNWFLEKRGPTMTRGVFSSGFKLALHHKDLEICRRMAGTLACRLPLIEQTLRDYAELMASGHGDEDISALYRLKAP